MSTLPRRWIARAILCGALACAPARADTVPPDILSSARALADMIQAARAVISESQTLINDPSIGDKGLTGQVVLARTLAGYKAATGRDPVAGDQTTREARLLKWQMEAIVEAVDSHQATINVRGTGFKAFIPAAFTRLVNEAFARRAGTEAHVKQTAPRPLIRNRKALPDAAESAAIAEHFLSPTWPKGQALAIDGANGPRPAFRILFPEYYSESCMSCHGLPKGSIDITGYPREGAKAGDLGGVLSITIAR